MEAFSYVSFRRARRTRMLTLPRIFLGGHICFIIVTTFAEIPIYARVMVKAPQVQTRLPKKLPIIAITVIRGINIALPILILVTYAEAKTPKEYWLTGIYMGIERCVALFSFPGFLKQIMWWITKVGFLVMERAWRKEGSSGASTTRLTGSVSRNPSADESIGPLWSSNVKFPLYPDGVSLNPLR